MINATVLSAILTIIYITVITVAGELYPPLKEFLAKTPDHMGGWMEVGLIRKGLCDYQGAADVWTYVGEIRPENSLSFANLGDLHTHFLVDYPKAEAAYLRAIENEKHDVNYFRNFFELYYYSYTEKKHLAEKVLLDGLNYNPDSHDLMTLLASYYRDNGNKEKAIEYTYEFLAKELKLKIGYVSVFDGDKENNIPPDHTTTTRTIPEGSHTWYMVAIDSANNLTQTETRNCGVDLTQPGTFDLSSPPHQEWQNTSVIMPALAEIKVRRTWRGLYPMTPDGFPVVDFPAALKGYVLAVGMCGQGFMLGPGLAQTLAAHISGQASADDREILAGFRLERNFSGQEKLK